MKLSCKRLQTWQNRSARALGVVAGASAPLPVIPVDARHRGRRASTVCPSATPASVAVSKHENGMKRIALDVGARHRGVEEAQVERRVVADQDRASAAVRADGVAHLAEHALQRVALGHRRAQRVMGSMPVTSSDAGSSREPSKGCTWKACVAPRRSVPLGVHVDQHRGDFEQRIGARS